MYESFLPDFTGAQAFYAKYQSQELCEIFVSNAKQYFASNDVEYTIEESGDNIKFNTAKGLFILSFRNNIPSAVSVYSIANPFVKGFRDSLWRTKKVFGIPVGAVMDDADDGYFETHPSRFKVIIFPKM